MRQARCIPSVTLLFLLCVMIVLQSWSMEDLILLQGALHNFADSLLCLQEHARAVAELRHVEEVLQDVTRQLRAAEGEEEALRAKVGHMRQEADIAQAACDRARAAEAAALRVNASSFACYTQRLVRIWVFASLHRSWLPQPAGSMGLSSGLHGSLNPPFPLYTISASKCFSLQFAGCQGGTGAGPGSSAGGRGGSHAGAEGVQGRCG